MQDRLGDENRIRHVIDAISTIQQYTQNVDFDGFKENAMMQVRVFANWVLSVKPVIEYQKTCKPQIKMSHGDRLLV